MSGASMEAVAFAVVLGAVAIAAVVSLLRRPRTRPGALERVDRR